MVQAIKAPPLKKREKSQAENIDELMDYIKQGGSLGLEIEKRFQELPEKCSVLLVTSQEKYDLLIANLVKNFTKKGVPGIFVTINKDGQEIVELLKENKVDCTNVFIVDAISRNRNPENARGKGNITYVDSPQDLTEMEAQINDFAEKLPRGRKFLILDSLSTMLVYNAEKTVEKFVHTLGERLRLEGFQAVFTIMKETKPEIITVLAQFCDKVIKPSPQISP